MKKALVIGIDDYPGHPLRCCVNDATEVAKLLKTNEDGSRNFDVELLTSQAGDVTNWGLEQALSRLFKSSTRAETAVLYFAGHGIINPLMDAGYIVGKDGRPGATGVPLSMLLDLANQAQEASRVVNLDCCHAGHLGAATSGSAGTASAIGTGLTILTSCNDDEKAKERGQHGVFTSLLLDGLRGGCADIQGNITPASLYSHIDQALGAFDQRPLYKANVQRFVTLRHVAPRIALDVLRRLPMHFTDPDMDYPLDPSYEPDRQSVSASIKRIPVDLEHARVFKELQMYNRQGLVVPVGAEHMFFAAMESKGCKLTALGKHYRHLAETGRI